MTQFTTPPLTTAAPPLSPPPRGRLRTVLKIMALVLGAIFLALQFVPVKGLGINPPTTFKLDAPPEVATILQHACMDCHSNETKWPFYARIAPGSWLMARDVRKGRSRMNFSEWGDTDEDERNTDKENSWEQIQEGEMPPWFYLPMHPKARLSDADKALLKGWFLAHKKPS